MCRSQFELSDVWTAHFTRKCKKRILQRINAVKGNNFTKINIVSTKTFDKQFCRYEACFFFNKRDHFFFSNKTHKMRSFSPSKWVYLIAIDWTTGQPYSLNPIIYSANISAISYTIFNLISPNVVGTRADLLVETNYKSIIHQ